MKHLDLFSGIGGFALAAERVGWQTIGFCEIEPFCQRILSERFPGVPIHEDVQALTAEQVGPVSVITAGFPCQDISYAGVGAGLKGKRSGLWYEVARLVGELRPPFVVLENVSALLSRGLDIVLGDLASLGYDAEWHCIPASAIGAPHRRDRIWIVAYPALADSNRHGGDEGALRVTDASSAPRSSMELSEKPEGQEAGEVSNAYRARREVADSLELRHDFIPARIHAAIPDADIPRLEGRLQDRIADAKRWQEPRDGRATKCRAGWQRGGDGTWAVEPDVGRVADGIPDRVDRLKALGNAIVPAIAEMIFRAIDDLENEMS